MLKQVERCTGHCCKNFTLPFSPMEMNFWHKVALRGRRKRWGEDTFKVPPMLNFLYADKLVVNASKTPYQNKSEVARYHYSCKNYDDVTGNCKIYETRPSMCSSFNDRGQNCTYRDCTCKFEYVDEPALEKMSFSDMPSEDIKCQSKCGECKAGC